MVKNADFLLFYFADNQLFSNCETLVIKNRNGDMIKQVKSVFEKVANKKLNILWGGR